jgi:hypothetical protein
MRLAAIEIYNEISGYWLWPLATPDIDAVIDRAMRRVARLVSKDYRAPVKVECCGFTIFRCCCRKGRPKSNVVSSIFNGMERREVELMEARKVADYMENGDERFEKRGYLLEDDAYNADRRLKRMDDDDYTEYSYGTRGSRGSRSGYSRSAYSRGSYSKSSYTRGGDSRYTEDESRGGSYSRNGDSRHLKGGDYSRGGSHYSKADASHYSHGDSYSRDGDAYSRASQSRAGSTVYTEDGDSFTKEVADASKGIHASMDPSNKSGYSSRHASATSKQSRGDASGKQFGVSGEWPPSSYSKESIHWDEASESQYYR